VSNPELVKARDLDLWARDVTSHFEASILVRRLILATASVAQIDLGAREDVFLPGWDGVVDAHGGNPYVPDGASRWEIGVKRTGLQAKAQSDYEKRTANPLGADPARTTFVFTTVQSAHWRKKWRDSRREEGVWADVRAYGASDLETWLEGVPSVHHWISERLGRSPRDVMSPDTWWRNWSRQTSPALSPSFLMAGRDAVVPAVSGSVNAPGTMTSVTAPSREEALAVICASLVNGGQASGELRARALIVSGAAAWARIANASSGLVLVPDFDDPDVAAALAGGHRVIVPAGGDAALRGAVIRVPKLDRLAAASALVGEDGMDWKAAGAHAAHARRSLLSFRRSIALATVVRKPAWSEGEQGRRLVPFLLAGEWNDGTDGDRKAIEMIAARPYADIDGDLAVWSALEDPPVHRAGQTWRIVSRPAVWDLLSPLITAADTARFHRLAAEVLQQPDPALDVAPERRFMAAVIGEPRVYSARLRDSIADTAAFLAGYVGDRELKDGRTGAEHASDLVAAVTRHMNADPTGRAWESAAEVLPLLAEASPDGFLSAVEAGSAGETPVLLPLFKDAEEASHFGVTSPHVPLVEALQVLCWSELYLGRAAAALARLVTLDPHPRQPGSIRPAKALAGVLSVYGPQTPAPPLTRVAVSEALRRRFPAVAWPLLRDAIPERHDQRPSTRHPRWREWHRNPGAENSADQAAAAGHIVSRMIEEAGTDAARWADLVDALKKLPHRDRDRVLSAVENLDPCGLSSTDRVTVWRALTEVAARHRQFPGTWWAMPAAVICRIEGAARRFTPESPTDLYSGLFSGAPTLPGASYDNAGYWETLRSARHEALRAVTGDAGASGLLALGRNAELPATVGQAAAEIAGDLFTADLLPLLEADGIDSQVARGYAGARIDAEGVGWAEGQLRRHPEWAAGQQARLLLAAPQPGRPLLELLRELDPEVQAIYWQRMNPTAISGPDARRTAAGELARRGRPCSATQILAPLANSGPGLSEPGDVTLVETVLLNLAAGPRADGDNPAEHYGEIRDLLDYLEREGSEIATRARLEFLFTVLLDQFRPARALAAVLRAEPEAFAEIVSAAYLPDGQTRDDTVITAHRRNLSIIGITALGSWRTPPGIRADNSIDAAYLASWVFKARELLAKTGHARIGDKTIGRILAHSPTDSEGTWPPEPVRDLIEELGCDDLESGLLDGKISTGMMIRSPDCGGDADRAAAAQFRRWAGQATSHWRTAAMLRTLAAYMEERARSQDRFSQEIQDLGP
jgi:hypothetical protein